MSKPLQIRKKQQSSEQRSFCNNVIDNEVELQIEKFLSLDKSTYSNQIINRIKDDKNMPR